MDDRGSAEKPGEGAAAGGGASRRLAMALSRLLIAGIVASACLISLSGVAVLFQDGTKQVSLSSFKGGSEVRTLHEVLKGVGTMDARAFLTLGVLVVLVTPLARVVFSMAAFAKERDWMYVTITGIVVAILSYSMFFGRV